MTGKEPASPIAQRKTTGPLPGLRGSSFKRQLQDAIDSTGAVANKDALEQLLDESIEDEYQEAEGERHGAGEVSICHQVFDISSQLSDAASAIADDSFWRCFAMNEPEPWNWNIYLFPLWCIGLLLRYLVIFPIRLLIFTVGHLLFFTMLLSVFTFMKEGPAQGRALANLARFLCQTYVASWTGVIRYHGPSPVKRPNHIWVANHTSMIDFAVLTAHTPFSVIMQLHDSWMGWMQRKFLEPQGCIHFNRNEVSDRKIVSDRMKMHVMDPNKPPLLIFPEGTCVNNEYCVMFKRGAFDLGATVCPVAIKYNKIFVDAFWNSKAKSFSMHLMDLMTSWAVVCDVYFLEPQVKAPDESPVAFAGRVQQLIATHANLRVVPWDGYLKYYNLADKHPEIVEKRQRVVREALEKFAPPQADGMGVERPEQGTLRQRKAEAAE